MHSSVTRVGLLLLVLTACEEPYGPLACDYEVRATSCSDSSFGPWESDCLDVLEPRDDLTPEGWCDLITDDTIECGGGCCLSFQYREAEGRRGTCDGA